MSGSLHTFLCVRCCNIHVPSEWASESGELPGQRVTVKEDGCAYSGSLLVALPPLVSLAQSRLATMPSGSMLRICSKEYTVCRNTPLAPPPQSTPDATPDDDLNTLKDELIRICNALVSRDEEFDFYVSFPNSVPRWTLQTSHRRQQEASEPENPIIHTHTSHIDVVHQQPPQEEEAEKINVAEIEENTTALRDFGAAWRTIISRDPGNAPPSKYHGVSKHKRTERFEANLWFQKRQVYLGGFLDAHIAARAHDVMALYCRGPLCSVMNFPVAEYASVLPHLNKLSQIDLLEELRNFAKNSSGTNIRQTPRVSSVSSMSQQPGMHYGHPLSLPSIDVIAPPVQALDGRPVRAPRPSLKIQSSGHAEVSSDVEDGDPTAVQGRPFSKIFIVQEGEMEEEEMVEEVHGVLLLPSADHVSKKRKRSGPLSRYSPYKGVTSNKKTQRWEACIWIPKTEHKNGSQIHLGTFADLEDAARVVDRACLAVHGRDAELNFPLEDYSTDPFILEHGLKDQDTFLKLLKESQIVRPRESQLMNGTGNIDQISSEVEEKEEENQEQQEQQQLPLVEMSFSRNFVPKHR